MSRPELSRPIPRWAAQSALRVLLRAVREVVADRPPRPSLGVLGSALAVTALLLVGAPALVPLVAVAAWWCLPGEPIAVLVRPSLGVLGAAWATIGIGLLAIQPTPAAGAEWVAIALLLLSARLVAGRYLERGAR